MPVTLQSRARRIQVFYLPHEVYCRARCVCAEMTMAIVAQNPRTGERARKHIHKRVPGSITFLARERKDNLPSALLEVPDVKTAIDRGYLRIVAQTPDPAPVAAATPTATAAAEGTAPPPSPPVTTVAAPPTEAPSLPANASAAPAPKEPR
jgi:hypothetical protein